MMRSSRMQPTVNVPLPMSTLLMSIVVSRTLVMV